MKIGMEEMVGYKGAKNIYSITCQNKQKYFLKFVYICVSTREQTSNYAWVWPYAHSVFQLYKLYLLLNNPV